MQMPMHSQNMMSAPLMLGPHHMTPTHSHMPNHPAHMHHPHLHPAPPPAYPQAAKSAGASGKVVVEVTIDEDGKVVEARAVSGHPMLQQAAVQAARLAKFSPAMLSGQPIRVTGTISYTFVWQ